MSLYQFQLQKSKKHLLLVSQVLRSHSGSLTRVRFTVWEVQLTDGALRTLDAEQRASRNLVDRSEERFIPDHCLVRDLPLVSRLKHQPSQRTLEHT